mmetsp:Transcript_57089/g.121310  ORF Transcript_57089/g.121310 Transcript_57089/m.121310 type:complete len:219 (-) Transcript_57089:30-686(-)|eukprot:CAMPEP_0206466054 /NCGR_PEP_ID=MMETSP0324_2-20121206/28221_1 /ASSEMBLY_ACC=CAM_ASM_000836 /TAXON_ID=2866 /ORGANISM="Crypthecodinium cohnii, Strain Seligo" /LENGTH=218 /DNA_ID=CAMNT_0053939079 /DNA_START=20 /DNA_END=676 /DNA_ORIENTATION=+
MTRAMLTTVVPAFLASLLLPVGAVNEVSSMATPSSITRREGMNHLNVPEEDEAGSSGREEIAHTHHRPPNTEEDNGDVEHGEHGSENHAGNPSEHVNSEHRGPHGKPGSKPGRFPDCQSCWHCADPPSNETKYEGFAYKCRCLLEVDWEEHGVESEKKPKVNKFCANLLAKAGCMWRGAGQHALAGCENFDDTVCKCDADYQLKMWWDVTKREEGVLR